jgi:hypothetical protein
VSANGDGNEMLLAVNYDGATGEPWGCGSVFLNDLRGKVRNEWNISAHRLQLFQI